MPASHERVPNRNLSGPELAKIIENDVHAILAKDGMFNVNISYGRVAYEVRVSLHLDNPMYPEHVSTMLSRPRGKNDVEARPELGAIELGPLIEPLTEDETVVSDERHRQIASPNMARVEHDMPLQVQKRNMDTGVMETVEQKFKGQSPDATEVGNITSDSAKSEDQRNKWGKHRKGGR